MARIRSVHPGQWTDSAFVVMSPFARLLCLAIRNEADDNGAFEWKPIELKIRLFPVDDLDVEKLLEELVTHKHVRKYEIGGKTYGLIRNFLKYQRPRSPKTAHPLPQDVEEAPVKEPPMQQNAETSPQRKEEGGNRNNNIRFFSSEFDEWWKAYPKGRKNDKKRALASYKRVIKNGEATADELLAGVKRYAEAMGDYHQYVKGPAVWLNNGCWADENPGGPTDSSGKKRKPKIPAKAQNKIELLRTEASNCMKVGDFEGYRKFAQAATAIEDEYGAP